MKLPGGGPFSFSAAAILDPVTLGNLDLLQQVGAIDARYACRFDLAGSVILGDV